MAYNVPLLLDNKNNPFKILTLMDFPFNFLKTGLYGKHAANNVSLLLDNNNSPFTILIMMDSPFNFL